MSQKNTRKHGKIVKGGMAATVMLGGLAASGMTAYAAEEEVTMTLDQQTEGELLAQATAVVIPVQEPAPVNETPAADGGASNQNNEENNRREENAAAEQAAAAAAQAAAAQAAAAQGAAVTTAEETPAIAGGVQRALAPEAAEQTGEEAAAQEETPAIAGGVRRELAPDAEQEADGEETPAIAGGVRRELAPDAEQEADGEETPAIAGGVRRELAPDAEQEAEGEETPGAVTEGEAVGAGTELSEDGLTEAEITEEGMGLVGMAAPRMMMMRAAAPEVEAEIEEEVTPVRIEYWQQNANDDDYTLKESSDEIEDDKAYKGFHVLETVDEVQEDGSVVRRVYYDRDTYIVEFRWQNSRDLIARIETRLGANTYEAWYLQNAKIQKWTDNLNYSWWAMWKGDNWETNFIESNQVAFDGNYRGLEAGSTVEVQLRARRQYEFTYRHYYELVEGENHNRHETEGIIEKVIDGETYYFASYTESIVPYTEGHKQEVTLFRDRGGYQNIYVDGQSHEEEAAIQPDEGVAIKYSFTKLGNHKYAPLEIFRVRTRYAVTFDAADGSEPVTADKILPGTDISEEAPDGYVEGETYEIGGVNRIFRGWADGSGNRVDLTNGISGNTALRGVWEDVAEDEVDPSDGDDIGTGDVSSDGENNNGNDGGNTNADGDGTDEGEGGIGGGDDGEDVPTISSATRPAPAGIGGGAPAGGSPAGSGPASGSGAPAGGSGAAAPAARVIAAADDTAGAAAEQAAADSNVLGAQRVVTAQDGPQVLGARMARTGDSNNTVLRTTAMVSAASGGLALAGKRRRRKEA